MAFIGSDFVWGQGTKILFCLGESTYLHITYNVFINVCTKYRIVCTNVMSGNFTCSDWEGISPVV